MEAIVCDLCEKRIVEGPGVNHKAVEDVKKIQVYFGSRRYTAHVDMDLCGECYEKVLAKIKKQLPQRAKEQMNESYLKRMKGEKEKENPFSVPTIAPDYSKLHKTLNENLRWKEVGDKDG